MSNDVPFPDSLLLGVDVVKVDIAVVVAFLRFRLPIQILRGTLLHADEVEDEAGAHPPPLDFVLFLFGGQLTEFERRNVFLDFHATAAEARDRVLGEALPDAIHEPLAVHFVPPKLLLDLEELRRGHDDLILRPLGLLLTLYRAGHVHGLERVDGQQGVLRVGALHALFLDVVRLLLLQLLLLLVELLLLKLLLLDLWILLLLELLLSRQRRQDLPLRLLLPLRSSRHVATSLSAALPALLLRASSAHDHVHTTTFVMHVTVVAAVRQHVGLNFGHLDHWTGRNNIIAVHVALEIDFLRRLLSNLDIRLGGGRVDGIRHESQWTASMAPLLARIRNLVLVELRF